MADVQLLQRPRADRPQPKPHVSRQRAVLERDGANIILTDLDTASYLHAVHNLAVVDAEKIGPSAHRIVIYDPEHLADELVIQFINSESAVVLDGVRRIKKILHRFGGRGRRNGARR